MQTLAAMELGQMLPVLGVAGGLIVAIVAIVTQAVRRIARDREREQSRRELGAYVAEGTMTADDAKKLLDAGKDDWKCC